MPDLLYFFWALLPIAQFVITARAAGKKVTDSGKREDPKAYFKALLFSVALLAIAILLDKTVYISIADWLEERGIDSRVPRWLIYPALLTLAAVVQQIFIDKKQKEEDAEKTSRRLKYAKRKDF